MELCVIGAKSVQQKTQLHPTSVSVGQEQTQCSVFAMLVIMDMVTCVLLANLAHLIRSVPILVSLGVL